MFGVNIPRKFNKIFASSAGAGFIRQIPDASQIGVQNGAASLTDGFPPNCFVPIAAGGSWPWAQDMNGLLSQITAWNQWQQAGGPIYFDAAFAAQINGYPKGTMLLSSVTTGLVWINTVDANIFNPDTGGGGWTTIYGQPHTWSASQTHSAPIILNNNVGIFGTDTGGTQHNLLYYGPDNQVHMIGGATGFAVANAAGTANNISWTDSGNVTIRGQTFSTLGFLAANGSGLSGIDTAGTVHPQSVYAADNNVYSCVGVGGHWRINNAAFTATVFDLDNAGGLSLSGGIALGGPVNATGDVIANGGHCRAAIGATGSVDTTVATLLGDFAHSLAANGWHKFPTGFMIQWGSNSVSANTTQTFNFQQPFPNACLGLVAGIGAGDGVASGFYFVAGGQPASATQYILSLNTNSPAVGVDGIWWIAVGF